MVSLYGYRNLGVYDGHGGSKVSRLGNIVLREVKRLKDIVRLIV